MTAFSAAERLLAQEIAAATKRAGADMVRAAGGTVDESDTTLWSALTDVERESLLRAARIMLDSGRVALVGV